MSYGLLGTFTAQAGKRDELVRALLHAVSLLGRDPGRAADRGAAGPRPTRLHTA